MPNRIIKFDLIDIADCKPGVSNVRVENTLDQDALEDLTAHIEVHGLLEPIVVFDINSLPKDHPLYSKRIGIKERYEILAGQRRWHAFKKLNEAHPKDDWNRIPAAIREPPKNEIDAKAISLGEGLTQLPYTLQDTILTCDELFKTYNDEAIVRKMTGISENLIRRYVKFNRLPDLLKDNLPLIHKNSKTAVNLAVEAADALRWAKNSKVSEDKVFELAKKLGEKKAKKNEDYKKLKKAAEENPTKSLDDIEKIASDLEEPVKFYVVLEKLTADRLEVMAEKIGLNKEEKASEILEDRVNKEYTNIEDFD